MSDYYNDTFHSLFADMSEAEAEKALADLREALAIADAAIANKDWQTLKRLGYAQRVDGPYEGSYAWELTSALVSDRELAKLTPAQYARRHNRLLDDLFEG